MKNFFEDLSDVEIGFLSNQMVFRFYAIHGERANSSRNSWATDL